MGRLKQESDVNSARRRHFIGSNRSPKRPTAGAEMFLVKRGEPANQKADIHIDKTISSKDVLTEWHDSTNQSVLTWQEPRRTGGTVSDEDRKSTWNSRCRRQLDEDQQKRKCANTGIM